MNNMINPWAMFAPPGFQVTPQLGPTQPVASEDASQPPPPIPATQTPGSGAVQPANPFPLGALAQLLPGAPDISQLQQWWGPMNQMLLPWMAANINNAAKQALQAPQPLTPISPTPEDDDALARAFKSARSFGGKTYQQILEAFAASKNQSSLEWKNYFLAHVVRFELLVSQLDRHVSAPAPAPAPAPDPRPRDHEAHVNEAPNTSPLSSRKALITHESRPRAKTPRRVEHDNGSPTPGPLKRKALSQDDRPAQRRKSAPPLPSRARTSVSAKETSTRDRNVNEDGGDDGLPPVPSRSPTPPTEVIPHGPRGGNLFTQADKTYFMRKLMWEYRHDSTIGKNALTSMMGDKAPHHSAASWGGYWAKDGALVRRIQTKAARAGPPPPPPPPGPSYTRRAARRAQSQSRERPGSPDQEDPEARQTAKRTDRGEDDGAAGVDSGKEGDGHAAESGALDSGGEGQMVELHTPFTEADVRALAKHVCTFDQRQWKEASWNDRWGDLASKPIYQGHTEKAWAWYYEKNKQTILTLAEKYRERQAIPS